MPAFPSRVHLSRLNSRRCITYAAVLAGAAGFAQNASAQIQADRRAAVPPLHAVLNTPDGPLFRATPSFRSGEPALFAEL